MLSVYSMRMARVNISIPDDVLERARDAGLNVSRLAAAALSEELDRRERVTALARYLGELDAELGPVSPGEQEAARAWADRAFGETSDVTPSGSSRTA